MATWLVGCLAGLETWGPAAERGEVDRIILPAASISQAEMRQIRRLSLCKGGGNGDARRLLLLLRLRLHLQSVIRVKYEYTN
jgi:hypothetical protein